MSIQYLMVDPDDEINRRYRSYINTGERNPMFGKHPSEETREKISYFNLGENNGMWKGGRTKTSEGYVMKKDWEHPRRHYNGYVYEHIKVLEEKLGRPLKKNEVTHHINGNKADNKPENLEVWNRAQHITHHHTGASYVKRRDPNITTDCSLCSSTHTKMNKRRTGVKYPQWMYDDNDKPICYKCYQREYYRKGISLKNKLEVVKPE